MQHRSSAMSGTGRWSQGGGFGGPDRVTRVSYHRKPGFLERAGNSVCGACFGFALLVAAFPILFWNEGRAVQTAQSLDEGLTQCLRLPYGNPPFESNNGRLVHMTGQLASKSPVVDPQFGISMHAARLERRVQMMQWVESQETREYEEHGETRRETTYSYHREWRSHLVASGSFEESLRHRNPSAMPYSSGTYESGALHVGDFSLSSNLLGKLSTETKLHPSSITGLKLSPGEKIWDTYVVRAQNPGNFEVGDVRIQWAYKGCSQPAGVHSALQCAPQQVSVIGKQSGSFVGPYQTEAGDVLELLYEGTHSAESIFEQEHSSNAALTWLLRFVGWLMMFIAFNLITSIITNLTSYIPFLGALINFGVFLLNLSLSISLSLFVIALGWLRYRPVLAFTLLAIGSLPYILAAAKSPSKGQEEED